MLFRELYSGVKSGLLRDFRVAFGEYCEVSSRHCAQELLRALDLCSVGSDRGTWWFFNIKTKAAFRGDKCTVLPTSELVIEAMNNLYQQDETQKRRLIRADNAPQDATADREPHAQVEVQVVSDITAVPTDAPTADAPAPVDDDGVTETLEGDPHQMEEQGHGTSPD